MLGESSRHLGGGEALRTAPQGAVDVCREEAGDLHDVGTRTPGRLSIATSDARSAGAEGTQRVEDGVDDCLGSLGEIGDEATLVGFEMLERGELAGQQTARHERMPTSAHALLEDAPGTIEVHDDEVRMVSAQAVAVRPFECAARHDDRSSGEMAADLIEPWPSIIIRQRRSRPQLAFVGLAVQIVGVDERHAEPGCEQLANHRLPGTRNAHDHHRRLLGIC